MRKETKIQVQSEIESIESDITKLQFHLHGINDEKRKTEKNLDELRDRKEKLKSYL